MIQVRLLDQWRRIVGIREDDDVLNRIDRTLKLLKLCRIDDILASKRRFGLRSPEAQDKYLSSIKPY